MADDFPYKGFAHFSSSSLIDRQKLGYNSLPPLRSLGGGFAFYCSYETRNDYFGYWTWDDPYWPSGDPGLRLQNPLPPLIRRVTIVAIAPRVVFAFLIPSWTVWAL